MKKMFLYLMFTCLALSACTVGPDYRKPEMETPASFKGNQYWKVAEPGDEIPKDRWWALFNDAKLNGLEEEALKANQSLKAAAARVMQARSGLGVTGSERYPSVNGAPSVIRARSSENVETGNTATLYRLPMDLSYEIDIWGRVRGSIEAAEADFDATESDYHTVLLTLQADVANNYFQILALDSEIAIVEKTVELRKESLKLVKSRFKNGYISRLDVEQALAELETTRAEAASLKKSRSALENSLAVLLGKPASEFSLPAMPLKEDAPLVNTGVPSELLERRPDVSTAERNMAAANARIGVAKAAFFPTVTLTGAAGYESISTGSLFDWGSRAWSLGPGVSLPIFNGGRIQANYEKSKARYEETLADYRQTVLNAFKEVEDGLAGLHFLKEQLDAQKRAARASRNAENLSGKQYNAGLVSYIEVVDAQRTALQTRRAVMQIRGQQLTQTVQLIKALGGGWIG